MDAAKTWVPDWHIVISLIGFVFIYWLSKSRKV